MSDAPDNPLSVLSLFDTDKKGLDYFIEYASNTIESGSDDPLRIHAYFKKMNYIIEGVTGRIKENINTAAEKNGEHQFEMCGTEMQYGVVHTKYNFEVCGDPVWNRLNQKLKERETFLKAMKKKEYLLDEETGEQSWVLPPLKTQTMGVKTKIK